MSAEKKYLREYMDEVPLEKRGFINYMNWLEDKLQEYAKQSKQEEVKPEWMERFETAIGKAEILIDKLSIMKPQPQEKVDVDTFIESLDLNPHEKISDGSDGWWRLNDVLAHWIESNTLQDNGLRKAAESTTIKCHSCKCVTLRPDGNGRYICDTCGVIV
jgi:hypothetical protein